MSSMIVYLSGPASQQHAEHLSGMPVLISFPGWGSWLDSYQQSFSRILIDSGAFTELNSGKKIDTVKYKEWSQRWIGHADAIAGVDDIAGDYKKSLKNYADIPWSFPTWHDSDPLDLIPELVALANERDKWLGIGLVPPRQGKELIIRRAMEKIPEGIHVHGWACRLYTHIRRFDSTDSTAWFRDAMELRIQMPWLTYGECLEIIVKQYVRWKRVVSEDKKVHTLF